MPLHTLVTHNSLPCSLLHINVCLLQMSVCALVALVVALSAVQHMPYHAVCVLHSPACKHTWSVSTTCTTLMPVHYSRSTLLGEPGVLIDWHVARCCACPLVMLLPGRTAAIHLRLARARCGCLTAQCSWQCWAMAAASLLPSCLHVAWGTCCMGGGQLQVCCHLDCSNACCAGMLCSSL
jgi:hypothetical protein